MFSGCRRVSPCELAALDAHAGAASFCPQHAVSGRAGTRCCTAARVAGREASGRGQWNCNSQRLAPSCLGGKARFAVIFSTSAPIPHCGEGEWIDAPKLHMGNRPQRHEGKHLRQADFRAIVQDDGSSLQRRRRSPGKVEQAAAIGQRYHSSAGLICLSRITRSCPSASLVCASAARLFCMNL